MRIEFPPLRNVTTTLNRLWTERPAERATLQRYIDRAKSHRNDCGCAMGGVFVVATLGGLAIYLLAYRGFGADHWLRDLVVAVACVFAAALFGKLIGVAIARARLLLLGRELRRRYALR